MADMQNKKLKNLFFYGVSFTDYDSVEVSRDIITNIRRRFLVTRKPATNKLYRSANGDNFVYTYNFSFQRPLQWKVMKNKRVTEQIEYLLSGKYCISSYDEHGRDAKKVFFDSKHRWFKTNYYNAVSGENIACSIVPKEFDEGTSLLKYMTGAVYPERLFPCTIPSCEEVRAKVLERIPTPIISALTDRGVVYFLPEVDKENYEKVLKEEEADFEALNAPEVFISAEDIAGGFNLKVSDFDMSKNLNRTFDISLAEEFGNDESIIKQAEPQAEEIIEQVEAKEETPGIEPVVIEDDGSVDAAITGVVQQINARTQLDINAEEILSFELETPDESLTFEDTTEEEDVTIDTTEFSIDEQLKHIDSVLDGHSVLNAKRQLVIGDSVVDDDYISSIIDGIMASAFVSSDEIKEKAEPEVIEEVANEAIEETTEETIEENVEEPVEETVEDITEESTEEVVDEVSEESVEITADETESDMTAEERFDADEEDPEDEDTDEIVQVAIDEVNDILEEQGFENDSEEIVEKTAPAEDYIKENPADISFESRGEVYSYYGSVDENGKRSGRGRTLMSDGSIAYEGEYLDDKRSGRGSFYFKDGSLCYWGNWTDNVRSGFGVGVSSEDKAVHTGSWADNKPKGFGVRFDNEGNLMFISSSCEDKKKGITISDLTDTSFIVKVWSEKDDAFIQREISITDIIK